MNKPTTLDEMMKAVEADIINSNCQLPDFKDLGDYQEKSEGYLRSLCETAFKEGYELSNHSSISDSSPYYNIWGQATINRSEFLARINDFDTSRTDAQAHNPIAIGIIEEEAKKVPYGVLKLSDFLKQIYDRKATSWELFWFLASDYFTDGDFDGAEINSAQDAENEILDKLWYDIDCAVKQVFLRMF